MVPCLLKHPQEPPTVSNGNGDHNVGRFKLMRAFFFLHTNKRKGSWIKCYYPDNINRYISHINIKYKWVLWVEITMIWQFVGSICDHLSVHFERSGFNVPSLNVNTAGSCGTHHEDSGMTGRKGGQENWVWQEIKVYSVGVRRWDDYWHRWEVREKGGLMGGLNVITRTAGGSKGWREKEIRQIRMVEGMNRDMDWRKWERETRRDQSKW